MHLGGVDARAGQVDVGGRLRGEQQLRELVGEQPVELLGHAATAAGRVRSECTVGRVSCL